MKRRCIALILTFLILLLAGSLTQPSPARSIADLTELIKQTPLDASTYFRRGVAYVQKSDYDNAIKEFTKAIILKSDYTDAYYFRGTVYHSRGAKGDADRAISDLTKVIKLDPNHAIAYPLRGTAYHAKGDYNNAIADLTEAILLNPNHASNYLWRGQAYAEKDDYDNAIVDFAKAISTKA